MNEVRKQIIELIGDYMDKILSEGCTITCDDHFYEFRKPMDKSIVLQGIEGGDITIIGHYDITAVLKYIMFTTKYSLNTEIFDDIIKIKCNVGFYDIPNKPLHLYNSKQEEDLLDLLLKIK